jgi:hypothetical protein
MEWTRDQGARSALGFDPARYFAANPDIAVSALPGEDPRDTAARHFREFGQFENRMTQPIQEGQDWDAAYYGQQFIAPGGGYGEYNPAMSPSYSAAPTQAPGDFTEADLQAAIDAMYAPPPSPAGAPTGDMSSMPQRQGFEMGPYLSSDGGYESQFDPMDRSPGFASEMFSGALNPDGSLKHDGISLGQALGRAGSHIAGSMGPLGLARQAYDLVANHVGLPNTGSVMGSYDAARSYDRDAGGYTGGYAGDSGMGGGNLGTGVDGQADTGMADGRDSFANGGRVPAGAYVIPADVVSAKGEGSTEAGAKVLKMKYGGALVRGKGTGRSDEVMTRGPQGALALSNGEVVIPPKGVKKAGGAGALERVVLQERANYRDKLGKIPRPAR